MGHECIQQAPIAEMNAETTLVLLSKISFHEGIVTLKDHKNFIQYPMSYISLNVSITVMWHNDQMCVCHCILKDEIRCESIFTPVGQGHRVLLVGIRKIYTM